MTTQEQLKIYAAYLPYNLEFQDYGTLKGVREWIGWGLVFEDKAGSVTVPIGTVKPILYNLSFLTKEELHNAGFSDHIDWLTSEREALISRYGIEKYLNKTPFGHIQYLLSKHYNVFGIPVGDFIEKSTLKTESND